MAERFRGEFNHSIDVKGRVSVPSKFRDLFGERFIVTKGQENCLWLYTMEEWNLFEEKLLSLPTTTDKKVRDFTRYFIAGAVEVEFDKQGRILITPPLRAYAGLDKEVTFLGVGNRAELWSKDKWEAYNSVDDIEDCALHLEELGIRI